MDINEIVRKVNASGSYFFSEETMKHFGTTLLPQVFPTTLPDTYLIVIQDFIGVGPKMFRIVQVDLATNSPGRAAHYLIGPAGNLSAFRFDSLDEACNVARVLAGGYTRLDNGRYQISWVV